MSHKKIKKILETASDKKSEVLDFVKRDVDGNCFMVGDIENFSLGEEFYDLWHIENSKNGEISSVLLRYYRNYLIYSENEEDYEIIANKILDDPESLTVAGRESIINKFKDLLNYKSIKRLNLASLSKKSFITMDIEDIVTIAKPDDIKRLFNFMVNIDEMGISEKDRPSYAQEITNGNGRIYYCEVEGEIVSSATITAECSICGTIIAVATKKEFRRRGFAKSCVYKLCAKMIDESKKVILFYNNPDAAKLYKKIGFIDSGRWAIATLKKIQIDNLKFGSIME